MTGGREAAELRRQSRMMAERAARPTLGAVCLVVWVAGGAAGLPPGLVFLAGPVLALMAYNAEVRRRMR